MPYGGDFNRRQTLCGWSEYLEREVWFRSLSWSGGVGSHFAWAPALGKRNEISGLLFADWVGKFEDQPIWGWGWVS